MRQDEINEDIEQSITLSDRAENLNRKFGRGNLNLALGERERQIVKRKWHFRLC